MYYCDVKFKAGSKYNTFPRNIKQVPNMILDAKQKVGSKCDILLKQVFNGMIYRPIYVCMYGWMDGCMPTSQVCVTKSVIKYYYGSNMIIILDLCLLGCDTKFLGECTRCFDGMQCLHLQESRNPSRLFQTYGQS